MHNALRAIEPSGDLRRELELLQQFGAPASVAIAFVLTISLAPAKARRFLDWLLAACLTSLTVLVLKVLIARPRPSLADPFNFRTAMRPYPLDPAAPDKQVCSWQLAADNIERLWSMPSSHTAAAVVFAVFLTTVFPRLRVFAIAMAALVAACRIMFNAHWPSDTLIGAAVATAIATPIIRHHAGIRLVDWFWIRFIDKNATPKWPATALRNPHS